MKTRLLIILFVLVGVIFGIFLITNPNPILHLMYSDRHMFDTSMKSDIVQTFNEMYPENKVRYVRALEQEPAIVFEMKQDQQTAFLAVGNFQGKNLTFMYTCFSFDLSVFKSNFTVTPKLILDNPC